LPLVNLFVILRSHMVLVFLYLIDSYIRLVFWKGPVMASGFTWLSCRCRLWNSRLGLGLPSGGLLFFLFCQHAGLFPIQACLFGYPDSMNACVDYLTMDWIKTHHKVNITITLKWRNGLGVRGSAANDESNGYELICDGYHLPVILQIL
jgi:hypothetical protein